MAKAFFDTNILVYAFTDDPRSAIAEKLLAEGGDISVQVLNEFANVARRKLGFSWDQLAEGLDAIRTLCRVIHPLDVDTHVEALRLAQRHDLSIYDALIVASALRGRSTVLYSEDLHHELIIDGRLRIENPFQEG